MSDTRDNSGDGKIPYSDEMFEWAKLGDAIAEVRDDLAAQGQRLADCESRLGSFLESAEASLHVIEGGKLRLDPIELSSDSCDRVGEVA